MYLTESNLDTVIKIPLKYITVLPLSCPYRDDLNTIIDRIHSARYGNEKAKKDLIEKEEFSDDSIKELCNKLADDIANGKGDDWEIGEDNARSLATKIKAAKHIIIKLC